MICSRNDCRGRRSYDTLSTGNAMKGIDVIGFISANCGLGAAARNTIRLLTADGCDVAAVDILLSGNRSGQDRTFDHLLAPEGVPLTHDIRLFHCNPPVIGRILENKSPRFGAAPALNVAVPFWELPVLPESWIGELQAMDVLLCPSRFIEQAVANTPMDPAPNVRYFPQIAFLPERHRPDRVRFGLPEEGVCFVMSFDMVSDTERKNPWGVMDAFNSAFTHDENAWLVIKLNTSMETAGYTLQRERLQGYAAANDRIIIIDKSLPCEEVISLYESCDVYVSLHRSEGLGLGLMETMALGKAVIATAWSGNMDFTNDVNACLVGYGFIPVLSPVYRALIGNRSVQWADPRIDEAAWWMRRLYEEPGLRAKKGEQARHTMHNRAEEYRGRDVFSLLEECYARKSTIAAAIGGLSRAPGGTAVQPLTDHATLFSTVSQLIKSNDAAGALALYDRSRMLLCDTPELLRFDGLMRQLRERATASAT
jgi:glycosyltransferase involved in cell wall biosynthesis